MTILLVDSDKRALDREAQRLSRRQSGIVVVLHSSAADAEKFAMHHDVDIVYVREKLDEMSGQELVRRILRVPAHGRMPRPWARRGHPLCGGVLPGMGPI